MDCVKYLVQKAAGLEEIILQDSKPVLKVKTWNSQTGVADFEYQPIRIKVIKQQKKGLKEKIDAIDTVLAELAALGAVEI